MKLIHSQVKINDFTLTIQEIVLPVGAEILAVTDDLYLHIVNEPFVSQKIRKFVLYAENYIVDNNETIKQYIQMVKINGFFYHLYELL